MVLDQISRSTLVVVVAIENFCILTEINKTQFKKKVLPAKKQVKVADSHISWIAPKQ